MAIAKRRQQRRERNQAKMAPSRNTPLRVGVAIGSAVLCHGAIAGDWERSASVDISSYYTTNVCLVSADIAEEEGKAVGTFRPQVAISGNGARSALSLNAAVEYNSLAESSVECPQGGQAFGIGNLEPWVPSINGSGQLEVVENWVDVYATAFASQNAVNPFLGGGNENGNALGNTNITYQWGGGARIDRNLPRGWQLLADVGYNRQYNSVDQFIGNSQEQRAELDFGRRPFASRLSYGVRGNYSEVEFDETGTQPAFTNRLSRAEIYAGLGVTPTLTLDLTAGVEDNVFISLDDDIDGTYWDAGFSWQPLERISVSAGYGERFFGSTPRFNVSYRKKRSTLQAGYSRDIQFPRNIRADALAAEAPGPEVPPVASVPGDALEGIAPPTFAGNSPILNDNFFAVYRLSGRRSEFELSGSVSQQEQLATGAVADFQSIRVRLTQRLAPRLTGFAGAAWNLSEVAEGVSVPAFPFGGFEGYNFDAGLSRPLGRRTNLSLRYRYVEQESDQLAFNNFTDQRVTLSLSYRF
jgi:uncharacterized protein (PEP-CTERM system associated)